MRAHVTRVVGAAVVAVVTGAFASVAGAACQPIDPAHLPEMTFAVPKDQVWASTQVAPAPGPGEGRIYVTDNLDDTVSIVDLDSAEAGAPVLLAKVPVGFVPVEREGPHHVTADAAGEFYYFGISNFVPGSGSGPHGTHGAGTADGHLMKMRVSDNSVVSQVRVQPNPGDVRLTPDGKSLLASHFDLVRIAKAEAAGITSGPELDSSLAIIDPTTMAPATFVTVCPAAHGIGITPDSKTAIMSCYDDEIAVVDLAGAEHAVTRFPALDQPGSASAPTCEPYAVTIAGDTAWVSCFASGQLIGVDIAAKERDGQHLQLPGIAVFGEARDGLMVLAHQNVDGVAFIDVSGAQAALREELLVSPGDCTLPHFARFNEDGSKIFLVCEGNRTDPGTFVVLDAAAPHAVLGKVDLGIYPDDMAIMRRAP